MPPTPLTPLTPLTAAIALGSNLGDRAATLRSAAGAIEQLPGVRLVAVSSFHETAPVPVPHGPGAAPPPDPGGPYLNAAAVVETTLAPPALLNALHEIERRFGRDRATQPHGAARTLDLDLLTVGDLRVDLPTLRLPHPRLRRRAFVLAPLAEIAPDLVIPSSDGQPAATVAACLRALVQEGRP